MTRVGSPRAHTRAITASITSTATVRMSSPASAERGTSRSDVVPGDGNTIDSNVNSAETIAVGMCERPVRSQPHEHRDDAERRDDDDQSEQRAEVRAHEASVGAGAGLTTVAGAGAGAGGLVTAPFVCVCTRGTR